MLESFVRNEMDCSNIYLSFDEKEEMFHERAESAEWLYRMFR